MHGEVRLLLWIVALVLDYSAPMHGFWLPGAGRTPMRDWTLAGVHLAERNQLVILIALGESIVAAGATFSELHASAAVVSAFVVGFVESVSFWWIYFVRQAEEGAEVISRSLDPTRVGRAGYAYAHGIMVGGIIVVAVAIDLVTAHSTGGTTMAAAAVILGGPAIYLVGNALFNYSLSGRLPWSRLLGIGALVLLIPIAFVVAPLMLNIGATLVILLLALAAGSPHRPDARESHDAGRVTTYARGTRDSV